MEMRNRQGIFLKGLRSEPGVRAGFRRDCDVEALPEKAVLRITARSFYRLYLNGEFVCHGPARSAHRHLRVDELDVTSRLIKGRNTFAFEIASHGQAFGGYSNEVTCEPGLLLCELEADGNLIFQSDGTWTGLRLSQVKSEAERMSHSRQLCERYLLDANYTLWRTMGTELLASTGLCVPIEVFAVEETLLERGMAQPDFTVTERPRLAEYGGFYIDKTIQVPNRFFEDWHPDYYANLPERPSQDYRRTVTTPMEGVLRRTARGHKAESAGDFYLCYEFPKPVMAFIGLTVDCEKAGYVDIVPMPCFHPEKGTYYERQYITRIHVPQGRTVFETFEPYFTKFCCLYFTGTGRTEVSDVQLRSFFCSDTAAGAFCCSDGNLNRIYEAARDTLLQNTLDIFMDCPDRERGGWLCDSLWTARAAAYMLGDSQVERAFLENYLMTPDTVKYRGFFPEVYPGNWDHTVTGEKNLGITTWSFWLMLELCEYIKRTGDLALARTHFARIRAFVEGSMLYKGKSGLLEDMPNIFIDWSMSNYGRNTQPISVPANALYAHMLIELGTVLSVPVWREAGEALRTRLRECLLAGGPLKHMETPALPDTLSVDADGTVGRGGECTEAAQYTALWAGLFEPSELPEVDWSVVHKMGPAPTYAKCPHIGESALFIGLCVRLDMLSRRGAYEKLLEDMQAIYLPQLELGTGTLWESREFGDGSYCHGFNSHAGVQLMRDILGIGSYDALHNTIKIAPHPCGLRWARGSVETPKGIVSVSWFYENGRLKVNVSAPEGMDTQIILPNND